MIEELKKEVEGEVYSDPVTRHVYSVDASIFEVLPQVIVVPKSKEDLIKAVKIAHLHHVPITVRGAATGITGGCLGKGLIIDTSKYLNKIIAINIEEGYAVCEPGVVQDDLNHALSPFGYRLGPDTSTGNRATLGGMLANNAAGARSLRFGSMVDHILEVELVLSSGETVRFSPQTEAGWKAKLALGSTEGNIYQTVDRILNDYQDEIEKHYPKIPRRVSGYGLNQVNHNIAKLMAGSEGTLGIATEIKVRIVPLVKSTALCLLFFHDLSEAFRCVPDLLKYNPLSFEMIDSQIIELGRLLPSMRGQLDWLEGHPKAMLVIEFDGEAAANIQQFSATMHERKIGYAQTTLSDPVQMGQVWALRKAGLGILLSKRTYSRAIAFIEDLSVSPYQLAPFMEKFCAYLESKGKTAGIYGHVGSGCMHVRPFINLHEKEEKELMKQMMMDVSSLILEFGGALSGEHGDGYIRSWLNPKMFGEKLMQAFKELKEAFDPDHIMNPGKIIPTSETFEAMRIEPEEKLQTIKTFLNFKREGGFELAVDLCNGNGLCRKQENVMCPSFQATKDEFHSTRARAQALRSIIHGRLPLEDLTSDGLYDVMDLCVECKGCKTECPSQVDMAKIKAEFLYQYQEVWGYPLRSRLFAYIGAVNEYLYPFAHLINWLGQTRLAKWLLNKFGISPHRTMPALTSYRFSDWFNDFVQPSGLLKKVILFNDTFNEFNHPEVGQAAVHLLNGLGYEIIVRPWTCCGRPAISKGILKLARQQATKLVEELLPYALQGIPIIGLEPSCILTLKDDYNGLISENDPLFTKIERVASLCITLDQFLANLVESGHFNLPFKQKTTEVKVHGHCHQKALVGMKPTMTVLRAVPGFNVTEIQSGCCGMAGSFGYEKEHYEISMKIGALHLFPAVNQSSSETHFVSNGTSCRQQIKDGTSRNSLHLAEILWKQLS